MLYLWIAVKWIIFPPFSIWLEVQPGTIFNLKPVHTDLNRCHLLAMDASIGSVNHCDGDPNLYVATHLRVRLPSLDSMAYG